MFTVRIASRTFAWWRFLPPLLGTDEVELESVVSTEIYMFYDTLQMRKGRRKRMFLRFYRFLLVQCCLLYFLRRKTNALASADGVIFTRTRWQVKLFVRNDSHDFTFHQIVSDYIVTYGFKRPFCDAKSSARFISQLVCQRFWPSLASKTFIDNFIHWRMVCHFIYCHFSETKQIMPNAGAFGIEAHVDSFSNGLFYFLRRSFLDQETDEVSKLGSHETL